MDVRDHTAAGNGRLDERVELLVTTDGELQMARRDALHLEVLGRVPCQLEHLGRQVLEDGRRVDGRRCADTPTRVAAVLEEAMDAPDGELGRERGEGDGRARRGEARRTWRPARAERDCGLLDLALLRDDMGLRCSTANEEAGKTPRRNALETSESND